MCSWLRPYRDSLFGLSYQVVNTFFSLLKQKTATVGPFEECGVSLGLGKGGGLCHFSPAAASSLKTHKLNAQWRQALRV